MQKVTAPDSPTHTQSLKDLPKKGKSEAPSLFTAHN